MIKVIIFGVKDTAELAHYYLSALDDISIVGFSVNKQFLTEDVFCGLKVYPFEELTTHFSPSDVLLFAPMTGRRMNRDRENIYNAGKKMGYSFFSYISPYATVLTKEIGENCFILEDNTIQPFVKIGNNVVLWSGNHIGHHSEIHDHVFFTSHVVLSGHCIVNKYSWFGVNATISNDTKIAEGTLVGMSSLVNKNTDAWSVYIGQPAKKIKSSMEIDF